MNCAEKFLHFLQESIDSIKMTQCICQSQNNYLLSIQSNQNPRLHKRSWACPLDKSGLVIYPFKFLNYNMLDSHKKW